MDRLHRKPQPKETPTGCDCQFCKQFDHEFERRPVMDRLVRAEPKDTAIAHMTENGEIKHRLLEIRMRLGPVGYAA